jgi:hypothetical protein
LQTLSTSFRLPFAAPFLPFQCSSSVLLGTFLLLISTAFARLLQGFANMFARLFVRLFERLCKDFARLCKALQGFAGLCKALQGAPEGERRC